LDGHQLRAVVSFTDTHGFAETGTASAGIVQAKAPTDFTFAPTTMSLAMLQSNGALKGNTPIGKFAQSGGATGDTFTFTIGGNNSLFALQSSANAGLLSTGAAGVSGAHNGQLYALTIQVNDTTNGTNSGARPFDLVIDNPQDGTINLTSGAANLHINPTTPTFIYGLGGNDTISAAGMTSPIWIVGGAGADKMTGGSGPNTYLYGATTESHPGAGAFDIITNFNVTLDKLDFTGIGGPALTFQSGQISGNTVAADTIGWKQSGGNTTVYVNTTSKAEALGSANMLVQLNGNLALTGGNILHS
jgi:hypothetical protein